MRSKPPVRIPPAERSQQWGRGFTLLELMIVVAIVGILAAIAYPNYVNVVVKQNRAVAKSALVQMVSRQEAYFILHKRYADTLQKLGYPSNVGLKSNGGLDPGGNGDSVIYELSVSRPSGPYSYKVKAKPVGIQADRDSTCGAFFILADGTRGTSTNNAEECW